MRGTKAALVAAFVVADVAVVAVIVGAWPRHDSRPAPPPGAPVRPAGDDAAWQALDPQGRCTSAKALVTHSEDWPMVCRWRAPGEARGGMAFPPPVAEPPWDNPRIEIYVDPNEGRPQVAHAIAHELGHMRLTREPTVGAAWLEARGLAPDTPWEVWVEDYAEVFAALFAPRVEKWYAPTDAPSAVALASLNAQFFTDGASAPPG